MSVLGGRYRMLIYPCGCSAGRQAVTGKVVSVTFCDEHVEWFPSERLSSLVELVEAFGANSGEAIVVDPDAMGVGYVGVLKKPAVENAREDDGEPIDGRA